MKNLIKKVLEVLFFGFMAGIAIGLGGLIFIKAKEVTFNNLLPGFLFSIGLVLVCSFGFFLYTGKICYLFTTDEKHYSLKLIVGLVGNYLGALTLASLCKLTMTLPSLTESLIKSKLDLNWYQCIILGLFCGMLIYFAVEGYKKIDNPIGKYVVLIGCVGTFIVCGFEHCVADMFYLSLDNAISINSVLNIILIIIGNSLGGMFVPIMSKIFVKKEE